jgi:hypothetical protein
LQAGRWRVESRGFPTVLSNMKRDLSMLSLKFYQTISQLESHIRIIIFDLSKCLTGMPVTTFYPCLKSVIESANSIIQGAPRKLLVL